MLPRTTGVGLRICSSFLYQAHLLISQLYTGSGSGFSHMARFGGTNQRQHALCYRPRNRDLCYRGAMFFTYSTHYFYQFLNLRKLSVVCLTARASFRQRMFRVILS